MKDVVFAFNSMFMLLAPYAGIVIIWSFINKIYKGCEIKKSLYFKANGLREEIDNILVAIYAGIYLVSFIGLVVYCTIFKSTSTFMAIIIFNTWQIIFTIVFYQLAVKYIKRTYCQVFDRNQTIKF